MPKKSVLSSDVTKQFLQAAENEQPAAGDKQQYEQERPLTPQEAEAINNELKAMKRTVARPKANGEKRSVHMQILQAPSLVLQLKKTAAARGISVNQYIEMAVSAQLKKDNNE